MRSRRISPRTSISTACSRWRDEKGRAKNGEQRDQQRIGPAVERQRADDVGGAGVSPSIAHDGVIDRHAAIDARAGERQAERSGHGRLGIAGIG